MDKHYYSPENIEAFIGNKLSIADKLGFEKAIAQDPLLKNEVELQQDIIQSLKDSRKAELKARLNNVDVSSAPQFAGLKIAASVLVAGLISYGVYSIFSSETKNSVTVETRNPEVSSSAKVSENTISTSEVTKPSTSLNAPSEAVTASKSESKKSENNKLNTNPAPVAAPEPADFENDQFQKDESVSIPEGKIAQETNTKNTIDIKEDNSTKDKFHYKFYNNKLFLYGNFSEKTYEILELNTYNGKQVYLYYDNSYYLLKSNQLEVTQLKKITDKKVLSDIEKLK